MTKDQANHDAAIAVAQAQYIKYINEHQCGTDEQDNQSFKLFATYYKNALAYFDKMSLL